MGLPYFASASIRNFARFALRETDMTDMAEQNGSSPAENSAAATSAAEASAAGNGRFRQIALIAGVVALIGGGLWYYRYESYGKYQQSTNDAYLQADAITVAPKVSGYVQRVFVADNQVVKAGDPLVQIDPRDYRAQASQFSAQMGVAAASAEGIRAQIREQGAAIDQAKAQLAVAQAAYDYARSEVARYTPLAASGAESREKLSDLRHQEQQSAAQLQAARAGLENAERRVGTLEAQIGQARSQGEAAQAQLSAAQVNLASTILRATSNGRIGNKSVEPGQFVQPGLRLMSVVPVQQTYIEANFKETQVGLMRIGQPVSIKVDAFEGATLHGRVQSISPGTGAQFSLLPPNNATGNFTKIVQRIPVRIAIDAGPETRKLLIPGMSVVVTVDTRSAKGLHDIIEREASAHKARAKAAQ